MSDLRGTEENNVILTTHSSTRGGGFCLYRREFYSPGFLILQPAEAGFVCIDANSIRPVFCISCDRNLRYHITTSNAAIPSLTDRPLLSAVSTLMIFERLEILQPTS